MGLVVNNLIRSLVEDGVFGEFEFVDLKPNDETEKGAQFASTVAFLNLVVKGSSGEKIFPLVVKRPSEDLPGKEFRRTDIMFYNEVTMYKEILPALGCKEKQLPKMYYGISTAGLNPEEDIVIVENLKYKGLVPSKEKVFLDFEHISLAIKKIAEFHSLSYKLKKENKKMFDQLSKKLKEMKVEESAEQEMDVVASGSLKRGIEAALKKHIYSEQLKKCLPLFNSSSKLMKLIRPPEEPFAVICHGDFCNNNLLFKYSETGEPIECVLFDFQLSLYSSPAIDLMFFLYMHTTSEVREKYWDEILKIYWDTLIKNIPTKVPFTFQEFFEHIEKRAIYGYLISAWFLPIMLDDSKDEDHQEIDNMCIEEKTEFFRNNGGEKGEEVVCDIILHYLKMNYLQKLLDFCNENKIQC